MIVFVLLADLFLVQDLVATLIIVVEQNIAGRGGGGGGRGCRPFGGRGWFLGGCALRVVL